MAEARKSPDGNPPAGPSPSGKGFSGKDSSGKSSSGKFSSDKPPRPPASLKAVTPFWREKTLEGMSPAEWESLCDGCGRCCLLKLEDEDSGEIHYTDIGCTLLDAGTCRCRDYARRQRKVPDCVRLTPEAVRSLPWLPPTCGYRLVRDGQDLPWWHPLVSGTRRTVHEAGISVRGKVSGTEEEFETEELPDRIVDWPGLDPQAPDPQDER